MTAHRIVCYLCRGARMLFGYACANCGGAGFVTHDDRRCSRCHAPLPEGRSVMCARCLDEDIADAREP